MVFDEHLPNNDNTDMDKIDGTETHDGQWDLSQLITKEPHNYNDHNIEVLEVHVYSNRNWIIYFQYSYIIQLLNSSN